MTRVCNYFGGFSAKTRHLHQYRRRGGTPSYADVLAKRLLAHVPLCRMMSCADTPAAAALVMNPAQSDCPAYRFESGVSASGRLA